MLLNLGCGDWPAPAPWINVDAYSGVKPDVVADIRRLPHPDGSAGAVYCGHVLEHLSPDDVVAALAEVRRVLAPGKRLCVVGPDHDRASADPDCDPVLLGLIRDGGGRWQGDEHLWLSTETATLRLAELVFPDVAAVEPDRLDEFWPVAFRGVWWQFALLASKE